LLNLGQIDGFKILDIGHFINDNSQEINVIQPNVFGQEIYVVGDDVIIAADQDQKLSSKRPGQGEGVQIDRRAVKDVFPRFHEDHFPAITDIINTIVQFQRRCLFIKRVQELGMMKTDAHIFRIFIEIKNVRQQCGVIVPETFSLVEQSRAKRF
jgi:hypothetical protein